MHSITASHSVGADASVEKRNDDALIVVSAWTNCSFCVGESGFSRTFPQIRRTVWLSWLNEQMNSSSASHYYITREYTDRQLRYKWDGRDWEVPGSEPCRTRLAPFPIDSVPYAELKS